MSELLGQISPNAESEDTVSRLVDAVPLLGLGVRGQKGYGFKVLDLETEFLKVLGFAGKTSRGICRGGSQVEASGFMC